MEYKGGRDGRCGGKQSNANKGYPLTPQQWSGADYADALMMTVTGGVSSTAAMGKGVTESQFVSDKAKKAAGKL